MKIVLISVGTRGDMEPFVAIAELLRAKGHEVICGFPEQFRDLVTESDWEFASLGEKFIALLGSNDGKAAMGGASGLKKLMGTMRLAFHQTEANKELLFEQRAIIERHKPDCVLYNGKAVYPILWHLKTKGKIISISPVPYMHYVKGHTHIAFNGNYGEFFNRLTFSLAQLGVIMTVRISRKWLKMKEKYKWSEIKNALQNNKSIYTISPTLFSQPDNWPKNLQVLGFHQRNQNKDWEPSDRLVDFIKKYDKILFITFGSMINPTPQKTTRILLDILERHKIPAIINSASGGLVQPDGFDAEFIHFTSQIPYRWIFPKVYGVIHHGGSGTTHLALKSGCATMIIPHIIDQFVWNSIIADLGVGPKGVKINKINTENLEARILDLMNNPIYKKRSEEAGNQMSQEDFKDRLYKAIIE